MAWLLRMPEVAANATEAVLAEWQVAEHAGFSAQTAIATVETDKAIVDIEADRDGVLLKTLVSGGSKVDVGAPIALLGEPAEEAGDLAAVLAALGVAADGTDVSPDRVDGTSGELSGAEDGVPQPDEAPAPAAPSSGELSGAEDGVPQPDEAPAPSAPDVEGADATEEIEEPDRDESRARVFSSPLARRIATESGLEIGSVRGSGPRGRVLRRDVEAALVRGPEPVVPAPAAPAPTVPAPTVPAPTVPAPTVPAPAVPAPVVREPVVREPAVREPASGFTEVPHTRMRRAIAARLTESKQTVPHFYVRATLDVAALLDLRTRLNEDSPVRISVNDLVVKAAAAAHLRVPEMNAVWSEDAVRRFESVDVAVAVATDTGLLTPVVRGVDGLTVSALATRTRDLAERAKTGRLRQDELEGGSLSVTNLGMLGTEEFAAIINPPQSAILAVGAARQEPVVRDGELAVGTVMHVTLSVDHRPVDGVVAARWMQAFVDLVEHPLRILI